MKWTSDVPTKAGWYWVRNKDGFNPPVSSEFGVVYVSIRDDWRDHKVKAMVENLPGWEIAEPAHAVGELWLGPIAQPEVPK